MLVYVGDFAKMNGPSQVDINLKRYLGTECFYYFQSNVYSSIFSELFCLLKVTHLHVSGVSLKGSILLFFACFLRIRTSFTMHSTLQLQKSLTKVKFYRLLLERWQLIFVNKVIVVSSVLKSDVLNFYPNLSDIIIVIPNGISIEKKKNIIIKNSQKNVLKIICVGGGRPEKQILQVCKSISWLSKYNIILNVVGESGEHTESIKSFGFVNYYGFVDKEFLERLYQESDLFIQFSAFESFSLSLFEAMSLGCYSIISDRVGGVEFVGESDLENISIVKFDSYNNLQILIEDFAINPKKAIMKSDYFSLSWENISNRYRNEFNI